MKKLFYPLSVLILFLSMAAPGPVYGQVPQVEDYESAKDFFERGVVLFEAGKYKGALENFLKSYELKPHYKIRFNIGLCYYKIGKNAEAANELELFLLEQGENVDPKITDQVQKTLNELWASIGILYINVDLASARILIDAKECGKSPLNRAVYVEPGSHTIEVVTEDGSEWTGGVDIAAAEKFQVNVVMKGAAKKAQVEKMEKAAEVKSSPKTGEGKAGAGKRKRISRGYFYAALGLTLAAAVAGSVTGGVALKKSREIDDLDRDCRELGCNNPGISYDEYKAKRADLLGDANTLADATTALLAISGALAVSSIVLLVFSIPKKGIEKKSKLGSLKPSFFFDNKGFVLSVVF